MQISILIARALAHELYRQGHSVDAFWREVALEPAVLEDPSHRLSLSQYERIVDHALLWTNDPYLGLHVGARTPIEALAVLGRLVATCDTMRAASAACRKYSAILVDGMTFELHVRGEVATQTIELPKTLGAYRSFGLDLGLALTCSVMRSFAIDLHLLEVSFAREAPRDIEPYEAFFGPVVRFGAERNAICYAAAQADVRQPHTNGELNELFRRRADSVLAELRSPNRLPARVREILETHERPCAVTLRDVSDDLGVHERALRRHLACGGSSFRELADLVIRDRACVALLDNDAPINQVALDLGFSDVSTFYRAFKRWTGVTPVEYRNQAVT